MLYHGHLPRAEISRNSKFNTKIQLCELRNECLCWEGTLDELIIAVVEATGMREQLIKQEDADKNKNVKTAAGRRKLKDKSGRLAAIDSVVAVAKVAEEDTDPEELLFGPLQRLVDFLDMFQLEECLEDSREKMEIEDQDMNKDMPYGRDRGKVRLMTIHASKGLEFDAVVVTGLEEGSLPLNGKLTHVVSNDINYERAEQENRGNVITIEDSQDLHDEEERRLLYVGMTRARRYLYLTHRMKTIVGRKHIPNKKSEFLSDLPPEHIQFHRFYAQTPQ